MKTSIFVGFAEIGTIGSGAQSLLDEYERNPNGFELVVVNSQSGVLAGTVVGHVLGITRQTVGPLGLINVATNTFAGAVTFLKIVSDQKNSGKINTGDLINLVNNVVGVVGTFAIMAVGASVAATPIALTMAAVGFSTVVNTINWRGVVNGIWEHVASPLWNTYYVDQPSANYSGSWLATDFTFRTLPEIVNNYSGYIPVSTINFETGKIMTMPYLLPESVLESGGTLTDYGVTYRVQGGWETSFYVPPGRVEVGPITYSPEDSYRSLENNADYYQC